MALVGSVSDLSTTRAPLVLHCVEQVVLEGFFVFFRLLLMHLKFTPQRICLCFAATPPHLAGELAVVRAATPVEVAAVFEVLAAVLANLGLLEVAFLLLEQTDSALHFLCVVGQRLANFFFVVKLLKDFLVVLNFFLELDVQVRDLVATDLQLGAHLFFDLRLLLGNVLEVLAHFVFFVGGLGRNFALLCQQARHLLQVQLMLLDDVV